ncbi:MAG: hypothetical protein GQ570_01345 [Helicobacteraceae bacterium]|nr:hypothetical protein [Helicobacteraceae bacterium]
MFKILLSSLVVLLFFSGCATSTFNKKTNIKSFENEDLLIVTAIDAENRMDFKSAALTYDTLYKNSNKEEYLYASFLNKLSAQMYKEVIEQADTVLSDMPNNHKVARYKIGALINSANIDEVKIEALKLLELTKDPKDYMLVSDIYIKEKKYDIALKYLESAYATSYDELILDKLAIVLYVNVKDQKKAIAYLETHSRMHNCSVRICERLASFYSEQNNMDGMVSIYKRLFEMSGDEKYAKAIVKIYTYKKDLPMLMAFLEESKIDDALLLQVYANAKLYKKAYTLADEIYAKDGDVEYLGQSAMFEYENAKNKNDKKMLNSVVSKFEKVINIDKRGLYLNYLGYLLIDHKIDIKQGIAYVKEAMELDPKSYFYMDSLAWGYYKQGRCKKAKTVMNKIIEMKDSVDSEISDHLEKINACLKKRKGKK